MDYVIKNGKAYPIVTPKKAKVTPKRTLDDSLKSTLKWFKDNGHKPLGTATKGKYTKKNGQVIPIFKVLVRLSKGQTKQYNISKYRVWATA